MTNTEGVIKYKNSQYLPSCELELEEYQEIEKYRNQVKSLNLIGVYNENGIGFGNISIRQNYLHLHKTSKPQFLISGSQTGHLLNLNGNHYSRVLDYDLVNFSLFDNGPIRASSEAVTHAAIYEKNNNIRAVVHGHNLKLWEYLIKNNYPSTDESIDYGTHEMALAIQNLITKESGVIVMKGHKEGVLFFANNLKDIMEIIRPFNAVF